MGRLIRLAFSPDSDDLFMFWPLLSGHVSDPDFRFVSERADTQALNERAAVVQDDVIAISIARYATVSEAYLLLPHGMSIGRGYGPAIVSLQGRSLESLRGARIGVPGLHTTAYWVLRMLVPEFFPVVIPIAPFSRVFDALRTGVVDAALVIHEGRLTFADEDFSLVGDLGILWAELTLGLPLPLGGNAIRRSLGDDCITRVSDLCRRSIEWALEHREQVMVELALAEGRADVALTPTQLDQYLSMYANEDTRAMRADVQLAIEQLLSRGYDARLCEARVLPEFAP